MTTGSISGDRAQIDSLQRDIRNWQGRIGNAYWDRYMQSHFGGTVAQYVSNQRARLAADVKELSKLENQAPGQGISGSNFGNGTVPGAGQGNVVKPPTGGFALGRWLIVIVAIILLKRFVT